MFRFQCQQYCCWYSMIFEDTYVKEAAKKAKCAKGYPQKIENVLTGEKFHEMTKVCEKYERKFVQYVMEENGLSDHFCH